MTYFCHDRTERNSITVRDTLFSINGQPKKIDQDILYCLKWHGWASVSCGHILRVYKAVQTLPANTSSPTRTLNGY
jgi:hypothetical protein